MAELDMKQIKLLKVLSATYRCMVDMWTFFNDKEGPVEAKLKFKVLLTTIELKLVEKNLKEIDLAISMMKILNLAFRLFKEYPFYESYVTREDFKYLKINVISTIKLIKESFAIEKEDNICKEE